MILSVFCHCHGFVFNVHSSNTQPVNILPDIFSSLIMLIKALQYIFKKKRKSKKKSTQKLVHRDLSTDNSQNHMESGSHGSSERDGNLAEKRRRRRRQYILLSFPGCAVFIYDSSKICTLHSRLTTRSHYNSHSIYTPKTPQ